jgi:hypothetical protein
MSYDCTSNISMIDPFNIFPKYIVTAYHYTIKHYVVQANNRGIKQVQLSLQYVLLYLKLWHAV